MKKQMLVDGVAGFRELATNVTNERTFLAIDVNFWIQFKCTEGLEVFFSPVRP